MPSSPFSSLTLHFICKLKWQNKIEADLVPLSSLPRWSKGNLVKSHYEPKTEVEVISAVVPWDATHCFIWVFSCRWGTVWSIMPTRSINLYSYLKVMFLRHQCNRFICSIHFSNWEIVFSNSVFISVSCPSYTVLKRAAMAI